MSFVGDLEHLPIVDVIQLLHSTRKSGTLCLKCHKGESQLVFDNGYIVSANHCNSSVRIGQILVEMKAISQADLQKTLSRQKDAGSARKPLIAALIENGTLKKEDAFSGLETLIEMTIVEVLTWTSGTFSLDVDTLFVSDDYRYFPETLKQDLHLNTQNVLMDALRIYDEKKRDGTLGEETFAGEEFADAHAVTVPESPDISADDLGLDDLDSIKKKVPDVFLGLKDYSPLAPRGQKTGDWEPELQSAEQEKFLSYLMKFPDADHPASIPSPDAGPDQTVVLKFKECIFELDKLNEAPDVALALLRFAAVQFERSITFIVGKTDLVAERGIGVRTDKSAGATPPMRFKIPLSEPSVFHDVINNGQLFFGQTGDDGVTARLFAEIGAPATPRILLLPIKNSGRVIALTYGDFGSRTATAAPVDLLEIVSRYAALVLDNALYRKKFEKPSLKH